MFDVPDTQVNDTTLSSTLRPGASLLAFVYSLALGCYDETLTQANLWSKVFIWLLHVPVTVRHAACCLALHGFHSLLYYLTQDHQLRAGITSRGAGPSCINH